jgi:hypothetical protein
MRRGRIFFPGHPWPEGHPIRSFQWTVARTHGGEEDSRYSFNANVEGGDLPV